MILKRPSEIIESNPGMKKAGWTANTIGYLFTFKLVRGRKLPRGSEVYEPDVLKVFRLILPESDIAN